MTLRHLSRETEMLLRDLGAVFYDAASCISLSKYHRRRNDFLPISYNLSEREY